MPADLDLSTVEIDRFEPLLNEKFLAQPWDRPAGQAPIALELVRCVSHPLGGQAGQRRPFSLFFHAPVGVQMEQGTCTLTHPQTGAIPLFLVPVARKEGRLQLQATFG